MATQAQIDLIARHEGFRSTCYRDTRGFLTIGYGFNLDAVGAEKKCQAAGLDYTALRTGNCPAGGISEQEAYALMVYAVQAAADLATVVIRGFVDFPEPVKMAVVDMIYNLGGTKFMEFVHLRAALEAQDWAKAAEEMRSSAWFHQVGLRATEDIALVESALETV